MRLEGKVRYVGLAIDDKHLLARACKIHPLACICLEWSLWKPRSMDMIVEEARKHGLAILAKDPLSGMDELAWSEEAPDSEEIRCFSGHG